MQTVGYKLKPFTVYGVKPGVLTPDDAFAEINETSQEALAEMRLLIYQLRPPVLDKEGLLTALQARLAAVEGRAGFYEHSGAIRDMVQSHMLQLLATLAMEPPASLDPDALRDEKLKVLRALKVPAVTGTPEVVVGQYVAGHMAGRAVPGYLSEAGVARDSLTETFVAFTTEVQTWRWAGVPFLLRTGKRMPNRLAEIVVQFRDVPRQLFTPVGGSWSGNRLVIQLQPDDRLELHLLAKAPGERERLRPVALDLDFFSEWRIPVRDAYERLITDILRGRLSLFLRRDEVEAQWKFIDRLRDDLASHHVQPLPYAAGSYGPTAATALAIRANAAWAEDTRLG